MISSQRTVVVVLGALLGAEVTLAPPAIAADRRFHRVISPDKSHMAYALTTNGDAEIYIAKADGKQPRQLTDNGADDNHPSWSADGKHLAFASNRSGKWQVYVMKIDGSDLRQVTRDSVECKRPKFGHRDRLAYLAVTQPFGLRPKMDLIAREGSKTLTVSKQATIWDFAWRPQTALLGYATDGRFTLFDVAKRTRREVRLDEADPKLAGRSLFEVQWSDRHQGFVGRLRYLGQSRQGATIYAENGRFLVPLQGAPRYLP